MKALLTYLPTMTCLGLAGAILLTRGGDGFGWGWFMLLGGMLCPSAWDILVDRNRGHGEDEAEPAKP